MNDALPAMPSVLVVCAHPDDESFGLGAILSTFTDAGSRVSVLCFTHGEASTLHGVDGELAAIRAVCLLRLPVLAWAIPDTVAQLLNDEFHTTFAGRHDDELDITIAVDRARQLDAIRCHRNQSTDNPVLWRRLDLLGTAEHLRYLT